MRDHNLRWRRLAASSATAGLLLAGPAGCTQPEATSPSAAPVTLPTGFPAGFPIPDDAVPAGAGNQRGDVLRLQVRDRTVVDISSSYRRELEAAGWTVVDDWTGVDPHGRDTVGLVVERDGSTGAVAVIDDGSGTVEVQVNLAQPTVRQAGPRP